MVLGAELLPARGVWSLLLVGCWVEARGQLGRASICLYVHTHTCQAMYLFKSHAFVMMPSAPWHSSAFPAVCFYLFGCFGCQDLSLCCLNVVRAVVGLVAPEPVGS